MAKGNGIVSVPLGVAEHAAKGAVDAVLEQPKAAQMHKIGEAYTEEGKLYREKLDNVSATAATADNVLNVATDPKKILGIIMLVGLVVFLVWLLKDQLKSLFGFIGDAFRESRDNSRAQADAVERYSDASGYSAGFENMAADLADRIDNAVSWWGDNEEAIYAALREVKTTADWVLLQKRWNAKERWWSKGPLAQKNYGDLVTCLTSNLDDAELAKCRTILRNNGVAAASIGF